MLNAMLFRYWIGGVVVLNLLSSCGSSPGSVKQSGQITNATAQHKTYSNPVFEPILADPTVVRDPQSKMFYAYGTADNWGDGKGQRLVSILQSADLAHWTWIGTAFSSKPSWKAEGGIWAPDVVRLNGKYILYYAYSTWGDPNPGIGVSLADRPEGPFIDQGKLFDSKEIDVPNSIDPYFFTENGQNYLFWGSFSDADTQGTYGVELDENGTAVPDLNKKFKVAAGDFEAVVIHKRKGYYYFIGSKGSCCEGEKSSYHVLVGRSRKLKGPYIDQEGRNLTQRGSGTLLLKGNDQFVGTGHTSRIITDDKGKDWILYHGMDPKQHRVATGGNRRMLFLDQIVWDKDWPKIEGATSSVAAQRAPTFNFK